MADKRKNNGRKLGACQVIKADGEPCKKHGVGREIAYLSEQNKYNGLLLRVRVCDKCWEGAESA